MAGDPKRSRWLDRLVSWEEGAKSIEAAEHAGAIPKKLIAWSAPGHMGGMGMIWQHLLGDLGQCLRKAFCGSGEEPPT